MSPFHDPLLYERLGTRQPLVYVEGSNPQHHRGQTLQIIRGQRGGIQTLDIHPQLLKRIGRIVSSSLDVSDMQPLWQGDGRRHDGQSAVHPYFLLRNMIVANRNGRHQGYFIALEVGRNTSPGDVLASAPLLTQLG